MSKTTKIYECFSHVKTSLRYHIIFSTKFSIEQIVRRLKQMTTKLIWDKEETHLRQFYWKKKELWTGGYFCSTVVNVSEQTLKKYIENQG